MFHFVSEIPSFYVKSPTQVSYIQFLYNLHKDVVLVLPTYLYVDKNLFLHNLCNGLSSFYPQGYHHFHLNIQFHCNQHTNFVQVPPTYLYVDENLFPHNLCNGLPSFYPQGYHHFHLNIQFHCNQHTNFVQVPPTYLYVDENLFLHNLHNVLVTYYALHLAILITAKIFWEIFLATFIL